jgi:hypothetical protein
MIFMEKAVETRFILAYAARSTQVVYYINTDKMPVRLTIILIGLKSPDKFVSLNQIHSLVT